MRNGTVWLDTAGDEIWCNGGSMLREGGTFWWAGYETGRGRHWGVRLYSSADLESWTFRRTLFSTGGEFARFPWTGRPALVRSAVTGKYVVVFEADCREWFRHKVGFAVADAIDGEYRLSGVEYPEPDRSTGDQSVFRDGDDAYLVAVVDTPGLRKPVNRSMAIYRLSPDCLHVAGKVFEGFDCTEGASPGLEAPHIIRLGKTWYWFASGLVGWKSSPTRYATATELAGPWSAMREVACDPASPDSFNTQHDFVFPVEGSEATTWVYAGDRYSQWHGVGTGRNIFLPLSFEDGRPKLRWYDDWRMDVRTGRVIANRPRKEDPWRE